VRFKNPELPHIFPRPGGGETSWSAKQAFLVNSPSTLTVAGARLLGPMAPE
jgi:hypothetical protein